MTVFVPSGLALLDFLSFCRKPFNFRLGWKTASEQHLRRLSDQSKFSYRSTKLSDRATSITCGP